MLRQPLFVPLALLKSNRRYPLRPTEVAHLELASFVSSRWLNMQKGASHSRGPAKSLAAFVSNMVTSKHMKSAITSSFVSGLQVSATSKLVNLVAVALSTIQDLKQLRQAIMMCEHSRMLAFNQASVEKLALHCARLGDAHEGLHWLWMIDDLRGVVSVGSSVHQKLLAQAIQDRNWTTIHFLREDLGRRGGRLSMEHAQLLIFAASREPAKHWRLVEDLLADRSNAPMKMEAISAGIECMIDAGQLDAASRVLDDWLKRRPKFAEAGKPPVLNLLCPAILLAHRTQRFDAICRILAACLPGTPIVTDANQALLAVRGRIASNPEESLRLGPIVGSVISWLLGIDGGEAAASSLLADFVVALQVATGRSLAEDQDIPAEDAIGELLHIVSRASTVSRANDKLLSSTARFLKDAVVNDTEAPGSAFGGKLGQACVQSAAVSEAVVMVFTHAQDEKAISSILTRSLAQGHVLSQDAMLAVLKVFCEAEEFHLVMELFQVYLRIVHPHGATVQAGVHGKTLAVTNKGRFTATRSPVGRTLAPQIFAVAIHALVKQGQPNHIVSFLTEEIPSRGLAAQKEWYLLAMRALFEQGHFAAACDLFSHSQKMYTELHESSHRSAPWTQAGYGLFDLSLTSAALHCCAKGRLGVTALELFASLETAERRGQVSVHPVTMAKLAEEVLVALADPSSAHIIPSFLQSLHTLSLPVATSAHTFAIALAAAATLQDADLTHRILAMVEAAEGRPRNEVFSTSDIADCMVSHFDIEGREAAVTTMQTFEPLKLFC